MTKLKLKTCDGKTVSEPLRYTSVIHVSPQAVVFGASLGRRAVAVKWSKQPKEVDNHCKAVAAVARRYKGAVVPLIGSAVGKYKLNDLFQSTVDVTQPGKTLLSQLESSRSAVLVMPRYHGSVQDLMADGKDLDYHDYMAISLLAEKVFYQLEDNKLQHGKPEPGNILYRVGKNGKKSFAVTDFSHLKRGERGKTEIKMLDNKLRVE